MEEIKSMKCHRRTAALCSIHGKTEHLVKRRDAARVKLLEEVKYE
jgi:hypothetical protein